MKKIILFTIFILISIVGFSQKPLKATNGLEVPEGKLKIGATFVTTTATELNHVDGVISPIQAQINETVKVTDSVAGYTAAEVDAFRYMFVMNVDAGSISAPTDATTYYMGGTNLSATAGANNRRIILPFDCTLIGFSSIIYSAIDATNETYSIFVRKNNTTDVLLSNLFKVHTVGTYSEYLSSNTLNISYSAGDLIELKIVTPTWATNPTTLVHSFKLFFKASRQ